MLFRICVSGYQCSERALSSLPLRLHSIFWWKRTGTGKSRRPRLLTLDPAIVTKDEGPLLLRGFRSTGLRCWWITIYHPEMMNWRITGNSSLFDDETILTSLLFFQTSKFNKTHTHTREECGIWRSHQELSNECSIEKTGVDTVESEPFKGWSRKTAVLVRKPEE